MTTSMATGPVIAGAILFGDAYEQPRAAISGPLRQAGVLDDIRRAVPPLAKEARPGIEKKILEIAAERLNVNVVDVAIVGWQKLDRLVTAAQSSVTKPETTLFVPLANHRIESADKWGVALTVDGIAVVTVELTLTVTLDVDIAHAVVQAGRLTGLGGGACTASVRLDIQAGTGGRSVDRAPVTLERRTTIDPNRHLTLRPGIPLCRLPEATRPIAQSPDRAGAMTGH